MALYNGKKNGFLMIELLFVMVLLLLFGLTTFTLVISGSSAYKQLVAQKTDNSDLRIAVSFVNMKVLQNEAEGSLRIEKSPTGNGNALVIHQWIGKEEYENWIYCSGNKIREAVVKKGMPPVDELSMEVASIDQMKIQFTPNKRGIFIDVMKRNGKSVRNYSTVITVNTDL